jgi:hypothetical protein
MSHDTIPLIRFCFISYIQLSAPVVFFNKGSSVILGRIFQKFCFNFISRNWTPLARRRREEDRRREGARQKQEDSQRELDERTTREKLETKFFKFFKIGFYDVLFIIFLVQFLFLAQQKNSSMDGPTCCFYHTKCLTVLLSRTNTSSDLTPVCTGTSDATAVTTR